MQEKILLTLCTVKTPIRIESEEMLPVTGFWLPVRVKSFSIKKLTLFFDKILRYWIDSLHRMKIETMKSLQLITGNR